jgi:hypothetical protein
MMMALSEIEVDEREINERSFDGERLFSGRHRYYFIICH